MARSDDKSDRKRPASRPRSEGAGKKEGPSKKANGGSPKAAPKKKAAAAPATRKSAKPAEPAPRARRAAPPAKPAAKSPAKPAAPRRRAPAKKADGRRPPPPPSVLDEEERIGDAKYQPRDLPPRLFEEERFIFPDSYGQSRIRLLVKDPDWLFAHWDVDPQSLADLRAELGERASALSSLTLRVSDPEHGGESRVLLPDGARSWYIRADVVQRSYRAELGLTLPSGEFRGLAESNTVTTPRSGPAPGAAPRRVRYDGVTAPSAPAPAPAPVTPVTPVAAAPAASASPAEPGPWRPDPDAQYRPEPGGSADRPADGRRSGRPGEPSGGASDVYRR